MRGCFVVVVVGGVELAHNWFSSVRVRVCLSGLCTGAVRGGQDAPPGVVPFFLFSPPSIE